MKFWLAVAFLDTNDMVDVARVADGLGYHGIMVSDHVLYPQDIESPYPYSPDGSPIWSPDTAWPDPWVLIGAMAAVTTELRFATNIYIAPARNPFVVAKAVGTAAVISRDRVALGLAAGWMREEFELLGQDYTNRGKRLDEMIEVLRTLWRGGMQEFHGTYFDFAPVQLSPAPAKPIPILVGGHSEPALRRAAKADGWIGNAYEPDEAFAIVGRLNELRKAEGTRDREDYEIVVSFMAMPSAELYERAAAAGVTSTLCAPWMMGGGKAHADKVDNRSDARRAAMEQFAETIVSVYR
ncbi:MAG: F420-dependent oxidoreductase [Acidimicrobiales bacterium]|nr:F420-dependent oxidoreductase [Acidimicrobiales bacterium]